MHAPMRGACSAGTALPPSGRISAAPCSHLRPRASAGETTQRRARICVVFAGNCRFVSATLLLLCGLATAGGEGSGSGRAGPIEARLGELASRGTGHARLAQEAGAPAAATGARSVIDSGAQTASELGAPKVAHVLESAKKEDAPLQGACVAGQDCAAHAAPAAEAAALPVESVADGLLRKLGDFVLWPSTGLELDGEEWSAPQGAPPSASPDDAAAKNASTLPGPDEALAAPAATPGGEEADGAGGAPAAAAGGAPLCAEGNCSDAAALRGDNATEGEGGAPEDVSWADVIEADVLPALLPGSGLAEEDGECMSVCDEARAPPPPSPPAAPPTAPPCCVITPGLGAGHV